MRPALRLLGRILPAAAAAVALACSGAGGDAGPVLRSIGPAQGAQGTAVAVRIAGDGLEPHVLTDYGDEGASLVDGRFRAWLGATRLRDVRSTGDGALLATVPEDLPAGTYDLAVEDPGGARATLPSAFRVLAASDAGALVASFRVDPVATQVARRPFAVTVTALDASGRVVTGFSGTAAISDRTGALVPAAAGPFAWGAWTGAVEVRAPHAADALAVTDGLGHAGASNDFAVLPAPAARVVFTSPAVDAVAGSCAGPVTVALEDLYGAPTAAAAPVDVAISGGPAAVYADAACAVPAGAATIAAGASSASVYVRSALAAPFVIDAAAAGLDPAAQPGLVRPGAPAVLRFTTAPQTVTAGACSAAAALLAEDGFGNVSPAPADTAIALSSAANGLAFHDSAGCAAAPVPAVTLAAGASTAAFWFRGTAAQALTVTAAGAGIPGAAAQGETVVAAAPAALAFVTASQAVAAGSCSAAATVEARDPFGNPATVGAPTAVALAVAPAGSFAFHLDAACGDAPAAATSIPAGAARASFRFRATATGLYDLTATGAGLAGAATQAETVGPAAADRVVFTSAPRTVVAGQCSGAVAIEVRDGLGNPAPVGASTAVVLAAAPAAGTAVYASADCSGPAGVPATVSAGSATATFSFRATAAGAFDASATVAGLVPGVQTETVQAAAPDRLLFTTPPVSAAAGACSAALTVEARDAYGNIAPVPSSTAVSLAAAPASGFAFHDAAGCGGPAVGAVTIPAGASSQTFWFLGTVAGAVTVSAAGAGVATPAAQAETVAPAAADRLVFTTAPQTVVAGGCSGAATVQALDAYGNVAPVASATAVSLAAAPAAGFSFHDAAGCVGPAVASVALAAGGSSQTFWFRGTAAGPAGVVAAGAGIPGPAAQSETIAPAAPARLVFTTAPQTVIAGSCSGAATVEALDAYGNVAQVAAATAVALAAAPSAGFTFHDAAGCGSPAVASVAIAAGGSSQTFWFRGTAAGTVDVAATGAGIAIPAAQAETVVPGAPDRLVFTTAPQTVTAGSCSGVATVQALDAHGNVAPVAVATAVALAAAPSAGFTFHDAAGCGAGTATASVALAAGASSQSFWFRATIAGTVDVTAAGAGIPTAAAQAEVVGPAAPDRLVFTSAPQAVTAGACSGLAVLEARDAFGNVAPVSALTAVALAAAPSAGFTFHDAAGCGAGTATASVALAAGASSQSFWFRATIAGTVDVTAAGAGIPTAAVQAEVVGPAAPDRLVFTSAPQAVTAGACSGPAALEARDAFGNVAPVAALTAVALAAAPASGLAFYDAAGCAAAPVASLGLAAGTATQAFWFRGTAAGTVDVTATGAGIAGPAAQAETVLPAAPDRLVFTTAPQTVVAGACSAAAVVEARDAYGNVAPVASATAVSLAAAPAAGLSFHEAAGCAGTAVAAVTLPAGASVQTFWFRGTAAGAVSVTAAGAGIATAAAQTETIQPAAPDHLAFTTPAQAVTAGACSGAATVEARDAYGNVAPVAAAALVSLAAAPAPGLAFYDAAGCATAPVASVVLAAGTATQTFWFRGTAAGAVSVTATGAGIAAPAAQAETIQPAAPDRLVFTTPPQTVTAGACSAAATVEARDAYGNVAPVSAATAVSLAAAPGAGFSFHDAAGCATAPVASVTLAAGASSQTFWFHGTAAGAATITATGAGIAASASQAESVSPAPPAAVVITTAPQTVTAGSCSGTVHAELRDTFGNPTADAATTPLALSAAPPAGFALFEDPGCAVPVPGAAIAVAAGSTGKDFWFRGTLAAAVTLASAPAALAPATQLETIEPSAPDRLVFTTPAQAVAAGACSASATLEALDAYGNPSPVAAPAAVTLSASPSASFAFFDAAGCGAPSVASVILAAGASTQSFWFRGTAAGAVTVTAAAAGVPSGAAQAETVEPAAPDRLVFTSAAQTATAGACSGAATFEVRDAYGNPSPVASATAVTLSAAPAAGFTLHDAAGCGAAPVGSVSLGAGAATGTFWFRGTAAGAVGVTAAGAGIPTAAAQTETIQPAAPDHLAFTTPPQTVTAGACSGAATVEVRDAYGNVSPVASPAAVALAAAPAAGFAFYDAAGCAAAPVVSVSLGAGGSSQTFWFRGTAAGPVSVTATGAGIPTDATQTETLDPAAPDRLVFTSPPQTVVAGACSAATTFQARDPFGNVAPVAALTSVALSASPAAGLQLFDAGGCGGAPLTSVSLAAGASAQSFRFRSTSAGPVTLTAAGAGIPTAATQGETVDPAAPAAAVFTSAAETLAAGACSGTARIELRDAYGNATADPGAAISLALSASPPAGFELFLDPGCAVAVPGASVAVATGTVGTDFWFRGTVSGAVTLSSAPAGLAPASQLETIHPAAASAIAFQTAPVTSVAGACSALVTVVSLDAYGNVSPVAGATTVSLAAAPAAGFELHDPTGCGGAIATSTSIAAGASTASFRFRGTVAGPVTITASAFSASASQGETVAPAAPDRLVLTTAAQTLAAGTCSGVATLEARDAHGNVAPVAALTTVSLAATPAAGFQFFAAAGCGGGAVPSVAIAAGSSSSAFWFKGTAAGTVTVIATGAGIPTPATQGETVSPAAPDRLVFTTPPRTVAAGTCAAATLEARDAYGNAAPVGAPASVALTAAPATGFQLFDAAGCGGPAVGSVGIAAGGSGAALWFQGTAAGAVTLTAAAAGLAAATQPEIVTAGAPDHLAFTSAQQTTAAGACSQGATIEVRDVYDNVATLAAATTVSLAASPSTGFGFHAAAGCATAAVASVGMAAGASSQTFWFAGTTRGAVTVTATGVGIPNPAIQLETVTPAAPHHLVFTSAPQTLPAGSCSAVATVESRDAYENVSPVGAATSVTLAAAQGGGFAFHDPAGCGGPTIAAVGIAAGTSTATFAFRGTAAGTVTVTAAGAGIPTAATQDQTIDPGPTARFAFDPVSPTWIRTWTYALRARATDAYGNPTPAFTGTAALSLTVPQPPNGAGATVSCTAGCASGAATTAFVAGAWTGTVAVDWADADPQKLGASVLATGSGAFASATGSTAAFDVIGVVRSPPTARAAASPVVVRVNQAVAFDASASADYQTAAASLEVSWDFLGTSTAAPPAAPWTAWTTTKTASNVYTVAGTYEARVAVRDADGDVGFGSVIVVAIPAWTPLCVVTTGADVDDGAASCAAPGPDGVLSLAEALRVAANATAITFAAPYAIAGAGTYTIARDDLAIVAPAGTILDGISLSLTGNRARIVGLEIANQATPITIGNKKTLTLEDCDLHDMPGITDYGILTLARVRMARCAGSCVFVTDASNSDTLTVRHSTFLGGPASVGIDIAQCRSNKASLVAQSNVFAGLATAVRFGSLCQGPSDLRNNSFASNGTGIAYQPVTSGNNVLRNNVFSGHALASVTCGAATFTSRDRHLLYQNASDACIAGDAGTLSGQDPLYLFPAAGDYRVGIGSPAVDTALDVGLFLLPQFPASAPRYLGLGPDRGGRETW